MVVSGLSWACATAPAQTLPTSSAPTSPTRSTPDSAQRPASDREPTTDLAPNGFGPASLALGLDLLRTLRGPEHENLVLSPLSISLAFAMPWAGAKGLTADEMERTLHYWDAPEGVAREAALLLRYLQTPTGTNSSLRLVNRMFVQEGFHVEERFVDLARDEFVAPIERVSFADPERARAQINARIAEQTETRIPELLPEDSLDETTRVVVTNAVYFLGEWKFSFPPENTSERDFLTSRQKTKPVLMMRQTVTLRYSEGDDFSLVELPYAGGKTSMIVLLPRQHGGLSDVEKHLTLSTLRQRIDELRADRVTIALPRLTLRHSVRLKAPLKSLGMHEAFGPGADFSGIHPEPLLYISEAYHQTFIKLDERGTEASAATAVVMNIKSKPKTTAFIADHPFLFFIRDLQSGAILFLGRVDEP